MASSRSAALLLVLLAAGGLAAREVPAARTALVVEVVDARSGAALPARVVVRGPDGQPLRGEYELLPGAFTDEDGRLEITVSPGPHSVDVHRGIDYVSQEQRLEARAGETARVRVALQPWLHLRERGWANGDAHAHLYTDTPRDEAMTRTVRRIARAQGVDFLCAAQTWAGYRDADWRSGYARVSDARFALFYGAEMPKYRTGHTFWYGLQSTRGLFDRAMDESFETLYHETEAPPPRWSFDALPFPYVPDVELVARLADAEDAFAVVPHPTSWWWQPRGAVRKYVTNVASSLPAGLLGGSPWRGLVVAGYDHDQYFYQDLWFRVLDAGYRMTPFGELDGGYPPAGRFWYGSVRTYLKLGAETTRDAIVRAARAGRTLVTSGPVVFARVEGGFEPGDVVPADGRERALHVEAHASGEREDRLSYVVLFRNSRPQRVWDLRGQERRRFEATLRLRESEPAWYALKAYGRTRRTPEQLDVRAVVDRIVAGVPQAAWTGDSDVALTSPFYFRPPGTPVEPEPLVSRVRLRLVDEGGRPVRDATVRVLLRGRELESRPAPGGEAQLRVPVHAVLVLEAPGRPTLRRVLYLDHEAPRARLERLASGAWLDAFGGRLQPGQVPWAAFDLDGTRRDLALLDWTVAWRLNERDPAWERFEAALR
jgi:hypothetical protein